LLFTIPAIATIPGFAAAQDVAPGIIYGLGGKFDKSFNEAAYRGGESFTKDTGISFRDLEITKETEEELEGTLRTFARDGRSPIVVTGFGWVDALTKIAGEFPQTSFAIVDGFVDKPNVRSITFKEQEGSYLAGVMAAMASRSGAVGFVGGQDIPLTHRFACGFIGGVKSISPETKVFEAYAGTDPSAWMNPTKGAEAAKAEILQGADVIYHAAGGTGVGVLDATAQAGKLGIGVDSNQNGLYPGHVLTSMLKRVDVAVYRTLIDARNGAFAGGVETLGLQEDGVGLAIDDNNKSLVTNEMTDAIAKTKAAIVSAKIHVHDYLSDERCPY
jgi:basic membrane protein A